MKIRNQARLCLTA